MELNFTINDVETALSCASVTKASTDLDLLPLANIVISGTAPNCSVVVTPQSNEIGTGDVTLSISDGTVVSDTTFRITVQFIDDAPVVSDISPAAFNENSQALITLSYTDAENHKADTCTLSNLMRVTVTSSCSCDGAGQCTVGVTGLSNYAGPARFSYSVTANGLTSNVANAILSITEIPAQIFTGSFNSDIGMNISNARVLILGSSISQQGTSIRVLVQARDAGGSTVIDSASICERLGTTADCVSPPTRLQFSGNNGVTIAAAQSQWTDWTPFELDETKDYLVNFYASAASLNMRRGANLSGTTYFDGNADSSMLASSGNTWATVTRHHLVAAIEAAYTDVAPITGDFSYELPENMPYSLTLTGSDFNDDALSFTIVSQPAHGTLDLSGLPVVIYTPSNSYIGVDSFTYKANDGLLDSNASTINLTINRLDAPEDFVIYHSDQQLHLSWSMLGNETGFLLVRRVGRAVEWIPNDGASYNVGAVDSDHWIVEIDDDATFVDQGLLNGTTYYYALFAYDDAAQYSLPSSSYRAPAASSTQGGYYSLTSLGGHVNSIVESGGLVYAASNSGLSIFSVSGSQIDFVGYHSRGVGTPQGIALAGNYVYLAHFGGVIQVYDIQNYRHPILKDEFGATGNYNKMKVVGDFLYATGENPQLSIFDISNRTSPVLKASISNLTSCKDVVVVADHAYLACGTNHLKVIDLSDKENPSVVGTFNVASSATRLAYESPFLYLLDQTDLNTVADTIYQLDLTDPSAPQSLKSYSMAGTGVSLTVANEIAYIIGTIPGCGFPVKVDFSPVTATLSASTCWDGIVGDGVVVGSYFYAFRGQNNSSMIAFSTSNLTAATTLGGAMAPNTVFYDDKKLFVAADGGLQIMDASNPVHLKSLSKLKGWSSHWGETTAVNYLTAVDVFAKDDLVAVSWEGQPVGIFLYDISNPSAPVEKGKIRVDSNGLVMDGSYLYAAVDADGLQVIDISDPANPTSLGIYDSSGTAEKVRVSGNKAFLADGGGGIAVVDVSNKSSPALLGSFDTAGYAYDLALSGNYAFVADGNAGLVVLDITDPANMSAVGSYDPPVGSAVTAIRLQGNRAYLGVNGGGLFVIDITDPTDPELLSHVPNTGSAGGFAVTDTLIYLTHDYLGLEFVAQPMP